MYGPYGLMRREPENGGLAREAERRHRKLGIDALTLLAMLRIGVRQA